MSRRVRSGRAHWAVWPAALASAALLAGCSSSSTSGAATPSASPSHGKHARHPLARGTVSTVTSSSLTLTTAAGPKTFSLSSTVKVRENKHSVALAQLTSGERVAAFGAPGSTTVRLIVIRVKSTASPSPSATP